MDVLSLGRARLQVSTVSIERTYLFPSKRMYQNAVSISAQSEGEVIREHTSNLRGSGIDKSTPRRRTRKDTKSRMTL